ncbi:MAG: hypothetical protein LBT55_03650 [Clostridiaceae bacterium]|jgi:pimeloyl-ACP methyl ester carboxylesterase|nr:hypothetical protein [Clostridiaceae bacterium]
MLSAIKFKSFDGKVLDGKIQLPKGEIKGAFLMLHGCPSYMDEYGFYSNAVSKLYPNGGMAEFLASNSYASLRFNYREQGKDVIPDTMEDLTISGMINDTEAAYWELTRKLSNSDIPIYVIATSFAGGIAVKWVNVFHRDIKKIFFACPLVDLSYTLLKRDVIFFDGEEWHIHDKYISEMKERGYIISGGKKVNSAFANEAMLINVENEFSLLKCKSIIFHGDIDTFVPISQSRRIAKLFSDVTLIEYADAGHGFVAPWDKGLPEEVRLKIRAKNTNDIYAKILENI